MYFIFELIALALVLYASYWLVFLTPKLPHTTVTSTPNVAPEKTKKIPESPKPDLRTTTEPDNIVKPDIPAKENKQEDKTELSLVSEIEKKEATLVATDEQTKPAESNPVVTVSATNNIPHDLIEPVLVLQPQSTEELITSEEKKSEITTVHTPEKHNITEAIIDEYNPKSEDPVETSAPYQPKPNEYPVYKALYKSQPKTSRDIACSAGDLLAVVETAEEWVRAQNISTKTFGWLPSSFVTKIENKYQLVENIPDEIDDSEEPDAMEDEVEESDNLKIDTKKVSNNIKEIQAKLRAQNIDETLSKEQ